jgi:hypothetical protein
MLAVKRFSIGCVSTVTLVTVADEFWSDPHSYKSSTGLQITRTATNPLSPTTLLVAHPRCEWSAARGARVSRAAGETRGSARVLEPEDQFNHLGDAGFGCLGLIWGEPHVLSQPFGVTSGFAGLVLLAGLRVWLLGSGFSC